ncbi:MAG: hypothetical protein D6812_09385 [Deltaproteobacteria bacterium]|nr:MAG: hypothetical protein D6812_09385 [Deltaproteobacteria bacterium]
MVSSHAPELPEPEIAPTFFSIFPFTSYHSIIRSFRCQVVECPASLRIHVFFPATQLASMHERSYAIPGRS